MLYGIAIMLMLYHHLFAFPERMGGYLKSAVAAKCCVSIYAFISGYGIACSGSKNKNSSLPRHVLADCKAAAVRYLELMKKVWLVCAIFIPVGFVIGRLEISGFRELLAILLGFDTRLNGEWWYIKVYIVFLVLYPLWNAIFGNYSTWEFGTRALAAVLLLGVYFGVKQFTYFTYTMMFAEGYIVAKFDIFNKLKMVLKSNCWGYVALFAGVMVRLWKYDSVRYDIITIVPIIYGLICLMDRIPCMARCTETAGRYSVYMWLTHSFYCYYYFSELILFWKNPVLMYAVLFGMSVLTAIGLQAVEQKAGRMLGRYTH